MVRLIILGYDGIQWEKFFHDKQSAEIWAARQSVILEQNRVFDIHAEQNDKDLYPYVPYYFVKFAEIEVYRGRDEEEATKIFHEFRSLERRMKLFDIEDIIPTL